MGGYVAIGGTIIDFASGAAELQNIAMAHHGIEPGTPVVVATDEQIEEGRTAYNYLAFGGDVPQTSSRALALAFIACVLFLVLLFLLAPTLGLVGGGWHYK